MLTGCALDCILHEHQGYLALQVLEICLRNSVVREKLFILTVTVGYKTTLSSVDCVSVY